MRLQRGGLVLATLIAVFYNGRAWAQQPTGQPPPRGIVNRPTVRRSLSDFARVSPFFTPAGNRARGYVRGDLHHDRYNDILVGADGGTVSTFVNDNLLGTEPVDNRAAAQRDFIYGEQNSTFLLGGGVAAPLGARVIMGAQGGVLLGRLEIHNDDTAGQRVSYSGGAVGYSVGGAIVTSVIANSYFRFTTSFERFADNAAERSPAASLEGVAIANQQYRTNANVFLVQPDIVFGSSRFEVAGGLRAGFFTGSVEREFTLSPIADPRLSQQYSVRAELERKTIIAAVVGASISVGTRGALGIQGAIGKDYTSVTVGYGHRVTD